MTDILLYWRDYRRNRARMNTEERAFEWHSNARLVGELKRGDRLWMVTSGEKIGNQAKQAGFLVGIWTVDQVIDNPDDDPEYPRDTYRFRIVADPAESVTFEEPVPVDDVLRPSERDKDVSIGRFLRGPRKLDDQKVRMLRAAGGSELAIKWLKGSGT